jgi:hypothetical protein
VTASWQENTNKLFVGAEEEFDAVVDQHSTVTVTVAQ